jgi:hypothetical protein
LVQESAFAAREARLAASEATAAGTAARQAEERTRLAQADFDGQYGQLKDLVRDLQDRIAALSVLARPLPKQS